MCYCCGEGDDELWEWTWCHCRVPLWCAMVGAREGEGQLWRSGRGAGAVRGVTTNFGGVDVVSLLGYGSGG